MGINSCDVHVDIELDHLRLISDSNIADPYEETSNVGTAITERLMVVVDDVEGDSQMVAVDPAVLFAIDHQLDGVHDEIAYL